MSDKRKHKPKRKRGQTVATLSGYTPYTVDKCIDRIKAGRSPVKMFHLVHDFDGTVLYVEFQARPRPMWPEPVWFEGTLIEGDRLTEVQGTIKHDIGLWMMLLVLNIPTLLIGLIAALARNAPAFGLSMIILAALVLFTTASLQYRRKLARILREWVADRLDI